ncbi:hypothetical protein FGKAn22_23440 [Ferrigenium kumadai]|uniref:O-antigen ligase-related domain-containing protein n=1 Tax=Ferrigenium kumadai TaxID=1682490 RepID=A0AAN1T1H9_9PROT|nr:hypothetical protein FGKAn22_23440 [Ferrigenium kumadai]
MHNRFKTILFTLFLWPISIGELSVNYSFVLFAAVSLFVAHKVYKPNEWVSVAAVIFSLIFLFSLPFTLLASGDQFLRATVSFAIFMTVFAFAITRIGMPEINSFRWALVVISCLFAGEALVGFLAAGGNAAGWELKNIVGSQRFGFIYILGFFVLLYFPARTAFLKLAKLGALSLILAGILLTFSRSSVIALSFAVGLYLLSSVIHRKNWSWRGLRIATTGALASVSLIAVAYMFFPVVFEFFSETILVRYGQFFAMIIPAELLSAGAPPPDDVLISKGSEGTRLVIWTAILQHTLENPILGSGYLGSWVLSNVTTGSAHNQYMDVLLRVGFLGFLVWILILYNVFRFLRRHHADLFWGGVGILIYGFFHETFKESQGAFILAFLVGMYVNHVRDCARSRNALLTQSDPVRLHTQATTHTAL